MLTYEPDYNRTSNELEEFLVFAICVAGKNADQTIKKVKAFFSPRGRRSPFCYLRSLGSAKLRLQMVKYRLGQYSRIHGALTGTLAAHLDLRTCGIQDLEAIHGIGPKTARFFIMFTRPNQRLACLDTHILTWMRNKGIPTPRTTPSGRKYIELEAKFLSMCDEAKLDPTKMDYAIWQSQRSQ